MSISLIVFAKILAALWFVRWRVKKKKIKKLQYPSVRSVTKDPRKTTTSPGLQRSKVVVDRKTPTTAPTLPTGSQSISRKGNHKEKIVRKVRIYSQPEQQTVQPREPLSRIENPNMSGIVHGERVRNKRASTNMGLGQQRTPAHTKRPSDLPRLQPSVIIDDEWLKELTLVYTELTLSQRATYLHNKFCTSTCSWLSNFRSGEYSTDEYYCQCGTVNQLL